MPVGKTRNLLYGLALPVLGKACAWKPARNDALERILHRNRTAGACVQRFEKGELTECRTVGFASLEGEKKPVTADTLFRTASIAKMVTALLVMRLQTKGMLSVQQDVSELLGYEVRNPHCPKAPITLGMLLSHTSSMVDSQAYFASFANPKPLTELLREPDAFLQGIPGMHFRYSNLAAGMIGCMLEKRFDMSFETLMQVIFAISCGFILTMVFYKSGSLIPCIIAHAMVDVFSLYGADNELADWIYIGATILTAIIYCVYLASLKNEK